jgi:FAD/FMN-containing dehydrogenase
MAVAAVSSSAYDLAGFSAAIDGIRVIDNPALVRLTSRDFFWYSPVLKDALNQKYADLVVCPCDEAEIIRVVRAAARFRVPITPRGGGTGNYGFVTLTGRARAARRVKVAAWLRFAIAAIVFRPRSSSTRSGSISALR